MQNTTGSSQIKYPNSALNHHTPVANYSHQPQPQPTYQHTSAPQTHQRMNSGSGSRDFREQPAPPKAPLRQNKLHVTSTFQGVSNQPTMTTSQTQTPLTIGQHSPKSPNQQPFIPMLHNSNINNGGPNTNYNCGASSQPNNANSNHNNNINLNSNNNNSSFDNLNLNNCPSSASSLVTQGHSVGGGMTNSMQNRKPDQQLSGKPWFHGSITRDEAERLLQPRNNGLFLVRESTNYPGDYTLCVCFENKVEHYRIKYSQNKLTIDDEEFFDDLANLIIHYEEDADGLCTQLQNCLPKVCIEDHIDSKWIIIENELTLNESIGKGEFGEVKLGSWKNEKVAVKVLKNLTVEFLKEATTMSTLHHSNIVKFHGVAQTNCHFLLIFEYMSKGSLVDYLRSRGRQHVTKKDQIDFAYDTCSGMSYLEEQKVIHRDLAARNVLISENNVAKICDLGLAYRSGNNKDDHQIDVGKLPIKWTAPEALKGQGFSSKSDMWSFGICLWEIYSFGRVPYPRIPLADVVRYVEQGYKMEAPEGCPSEVYEMMRKAWNLVPNKRPNFHELQVELHKLKIATTSEPNNLKQ